MKQIIITYSLKPGITPIQFEEWVRVTDQPTMRNLKRVNRFQTFCAEKLLMGTGVPSWAYIEIFDINDMDGFLAEDMGSATVQNILAQFTAYVENVEFIIAREI